MRFSRMLAVLIILCFTFAGTTMLFAQEQKVKFGDRTLSVDYDKARNEVTVKDETGKAVRVVGPVERGKVDELRLHKVGGPPETIDWVTDNCEVHTHFNPTCSYKFIGGNWVKVCVYP